MTFEELEEHIENNDGYCTHCKEFTSDGFVEPDACNYECSVCGNNTVFGAEECVLQGLITLTSRDE